MGDWPICCSQKVILLHGSSVTGDDRTNLANTTGRIRPVMTPFLHGKAPTFVWSANAARERHMMSVTDIDEQPGAEVVQLHPAKAKKASERKWGKPVMDLGFCIIPPLLLRAQARLGLNPTQLAVLMHLADYWWEAERKPFPRMQTLGERLKLSPRQARRYVAELEAAGLVTRIERRAAHRGKLSNEYDLSGLVKRLQQLEPEFRQVEEENKARRRAVARPGIRSRARAT